LIFGRAKEGDDRAGTQMTPAYDQAAGAGSGRLPT
jgi:hypothetical protein